MDRWGRSAVTTLLAVAVLAVTAGPTTAAARRWTETASSSPRAAVAMAFDPVSRLVVTFGGFDGGGQNLDQTWTWDGIGWSQVAISNPPPARNSAGLAFDRASRKLVLFGGYTGHGYLADTWLWDGATSNWTQAHPAHHPPAMTGPALFPDPVTGAVEEFGGFNGMLYQNQTWQWTGSDWVKLHPANEATARSAGIAQLDGANHTVVLFSGLGDLNVYDTWTWDGTDWTRASPSQQPPSRFYSASAYDPASHSVVIYGGGSPFGDLGDTWTWNGTDWREIHPGSPAARESQAMAFDPATGRIVMFGGVVSRAVVGETWTL